MLEAANAIGTGVSSRNSEVIHAGMYYPPGSLKARHCVAGNRMLRAFAAGHGVPFKMVGKLIVATSPDEERILDNILATGRANGVEGLRAIDAGEACALEAALVCTAALYSPATGIVDSHAYMLALQGDAGDHGAAIAFGTPVIGGSATERGIELVLGDRDSTHLSARRLVIAASLSACRIASLLGLPGVPPAYLCKGNYFALTGKMPFSRLVYPVPVAAGLGVHYTVDLGGRGRFGPDVEWIAQEDYVVDPARADAFYAAVRRYWPALPDGALQPAFAGIRPKIQAPGEPARDFVISGPADHGVPGVVALYGIESPGLTSSLSLADHVRDLLAA